MRERFGIRLFLGLFFGAVSGIAFCGLQSRAAFADLEVVESVPLETSLAVPGVRQTQEVWLEMINAAQTSLDLEQFYVSDQAGEALDPVLQAINAAAARGVRVRLLVDKKFYATYPDSVDQIGQTANCEARLIDFSPLGGVQHSKYFVVDGKQAFVGSQNFDWRALSHIHEVGLRVDDPKVNSDLESIFEKDWADASGLNVSRPATEIAAFFSNLLSFSSDVANVFVAASPAQKNPAGIPDSLSTITDLLASATQSVRIQVMEYTTSVYGSGATWKDLDSAVRKAASRGVHVQLIVDISSLKTGKRDLSSLARLANVDVMSVTIPQWSGGAIPFARLIHSKYMIVDGSVAWVGSENWSKSYFMNTRDVGLVVRSSLQVSQLGQIFDQVWNSGYGSRI